MTEKQMDFLKRLVAVLCVCIAFWLSCRSGGAESDPGESGRKAADEAAENTGAKSAGCMENRSMSTILQQEFPYLMTD